MNKTYNKIRLFLFTCSGEDNFILKRCKVEIQKRFALLGFFVLLIFIGCFFSATFFTYSLFDGGAKLMSFPVGVIWGTIIVNMYLLLLHTISPAIIPLSAKKKKRKKTNELEGVKIQNKFLAVSMLLRMSFMVLLAIIIAQPLNVFLFSSTVETSIEKHKIQERVRLYAFTNKELIKNELLNQKEFVDKIKKRINSAESLILLNRIQAINDKVNKDSLFIVNTSKQLNQLTLMDEKSFLIPKEKDAKEKILKILDSLLNNELESDHNFITSIDSITINGSLKNDFYKFKTNLIALVSEKINNYSILNELLNRSNFYVKTIQLLLAENPISWLITLLVCLLFLLPIYFKYKVRDLSTTIFKTKEQNEPEIIRLREELIKTTNFNWLVKKIKSTNIKNIRTSDYYFQRMLIEHKIILEEYDLTKKIFSETLTANIKNYNEKSINILQPLMDRLEQVNPIRHGEISKEIFEEYVDTEMIKYEYWLDCPFRTKRIHSAPIINNEIGLLDFVYNKTEDAENNLSL